MTTTAASLKATHVEFAALSDVVVDAAIAKASRVVNAGAWLSRYDDGVAAYAAHILAMDARSAAGGAAGGGGGFMRGPVTEERVGPLARSYGGGGGSSETPAPYSDAWLRQTVYGNEYLSLRALIVTVRVV